MLVECLSGLMYPMKTWALSLYFTLVFPIALTTTTTTAPMFQTWLPLEL